MIAIDGGDEKRQLIKGYGEGIEFVDFKQGVRIYFIRRLWVSGDELCVIRTLSSKSRPSPAARVPTLSSASRPLRSYTSTQLPGSN